MSRTALAVSEALYLKPLLQGLSGSTSPFDLHTDIPAQNALKLSKRDENTRCAFLSPIDYARHGGEYCIVPGIGVSSRNRTGTIQLFMNSDITSVRRVAVDIRVTSEIILAKIILTEKFRNLAAQEGTIQFLAMMPDVEAMLNKADAALVVNLAPSIGSDRFALDLVEEWNDLTNLPYVHGFWVSHNESLPYADLHALAQAKRKGLTLLDAIVEDSALELKLSRDVCKAYLSAFSYDLNDAEQEGISEFFRYAYYHGVIGDIPELNFLEQPAVDPASLN
ncbi:MAG: MqnA/MqnD/SBP family protein [Bacteroidota bacterium]